MHAIFGVCARVCSVFYQLAKIANRNSVRTFAVKSNDVHACEQMRFNWNRNYCLSSLLCTREIDEIAFAGCNCDCFWNCIRICVYYIIIFIPQHESRNTRRAREKTAIGGAERRKTQHIYAIFFLHNIVIVKYFIQVLICNVHWVYLLAGWLASLYYMRLFDVVIICEFFAKFFSFVLCIASNDWFTHF